MKTLCKLQTKDYGEALVLVGRYPSGGAIALSLMLTTGEPLCTFTTNLKAYGARLSDDEFHVDTWNTGTVPSDMMATGLFEDTGKRQDSGHVEAPVWRFKDAANVPPMNVQAGKRCGGAV